MKTMHGETLDVVLSDNIGVRCGCRYNNTQNPPLSVFALQRSDSGSLMPIVECTVCNATWQWGEVCAQKAES